MDSPPVIRAKVKGRQYQVLAFICRRIAATGQPPSLREIMAHIDTPSTSVARYFITKLVERGLLTRVPRIPRGIEVTDLARELHPELFPLTPLEAVFAAVCGARDDGEPLPARVMAVLEAVA